MDHCIAADLVHVSYEPARHFLSYLCSRHSHPYFYDQYAPSLNESRRVTGNAGPPTSRSFSTAEAVHMLLSYESAILLGNSRIGAGWRDEQGNGKHAGFVAVNATRRNCKWASQSRLMHFICRRAHGTTKSSILRGQLKEKRNRDERNRREGWYILYTKVEVLS